MFIFIGIYFKSPLYIELQSSQLIKSCNTVKGLFYAKLLKVTPASAPCFDCLKDHIII